MTVSVRRQLALVLLAAHLPLSHAEIVPVSDATSLRTAIDAAQAGDEIVLADGVYAISANLICDATGTAQAPIRVRAANPHGALINSSAVEGFVIRAPHWRIENLVIAGTCVDDSNCEHAIHIAGDADFTVIRDNRMRDFNAQIKSNGVPAEIGYVFPDDVRIEFNELYDTRARNTGNPVTKLDVVGGRRWVVRGNTIYDFEKNGGNFISYAAFLKGNSRDGLMERNLVICERNFAGGVRLGLSLGGGGTGSQFCEDATCPPEHQNGILRNNVILNCPDVGIYLNSALNTQVLHNTLYATAGIDVRFPASTADLRNNLLSGQIRNRDGGSSSQSGNLASVSLADFEAWFASPELADFSLAEGSALVDQGVAAAVDSDYCANARTDSAPDIGALEYDGDPPCDTALGGGDRVFADGSEG